ncbi:hypothetical protein NGR_b09680 (plasmid) [Sinorhizobium fredii NGR234]|uniref:Uncharacterized protein n=1 Tax=Sinorhizobium fredii (strain NBRC 101917 / NGR234) TaxID=394 RepID=C3KQR3_SINFN|nr:hypothetical protein NGR_b09680 [Sinorhizobium fredii NGR234]
MSRLSVENCYERAGGERGGRATRAFPRPGAARGQRQGARAVTVILDFRSCANYVGLPRRRSSTAPRTKPWFQFITPKRMPKIKAGRNQIVFNCRKDIAAVEPGASRPQDGYRENEAIIPAEMLLSERQRFRLQARSECRAAPPSPPSPAIPALSEGDAVPARFGDILVQQRLHAVGAEPAAVHIRKESRCFASLVP